MERVVVIRSSKEKGEFRRTRRRFGIMATALLVGVAACESGTAPALLDQMDTQSAMDDYRTMDRVLSTDGFAGFKALEGRTPFGHRAGLSAAAGLDRLVGPNPSHDGRAFALDLMDRLRAEGRSGSGPEAAPLLSDRFLGQTFVYDPATDEYAVDPNRTGAPASGVRFVVYEVDASGRPLPDREIGYADLLDEGASSAADAKLRWVMVESGKTTLDYRTSVDETAGVGRVTVDGFVLDDGAKLDFSIDLTGSETSGKSLLDMVFELRVDSRDFQVRGDVRGVEEGRKGEGEVSVEVYHRNHSLGVDWMGDGATVSGTILLNGKTFATLSGPEGNPTILGAGGQPITVAEGLVVLAVIDTVEDVFDLVEDLLDPVGDLIALGWIL